MNTISDFKAVHEPTYHYKESLRTPREKTPRENFSPRRGVPPGILHKVSDSDAEVSPLNTARSRGTVTFASPKEPTPEEEIINIRDKLKHFSQQKQKLKSLRATYRQLSDWLAAGPGTDSDQDSRCGIIFIIFN